MLQVVTSKDVITRLETLKTDKNAEVIKLVSAKVTELGESLLELTLPDATEFSVVENKLSGNYLSCTKEVMLGEVRTVVEVNKKANKLSPQGILIGNKILMSDTLKEATRYQVGKTAMEVVDGRAYVLAEGIKVKGSGKGYKYYAGYKVAYATAGEYSVTVKSYSSEHATVKNSDSIVSNVFDFAGF